MDLVEKNAKKEKSVPTVNANFPAKAVFPNATIHVYGSTAIVLTVANVRMSVKQEQFVPKVSVSFLALIARRIVVENVLI